MRTNGKLFIISAPSGAGKTSVCDAVVKSNKNISYSISYTARCPRKGERDGREYFFVTEEVFKRMIKEKKFAEWAKVHDNYYGTSKEFLNRILKKGKDVLLDIDVQGGLKIKSQYPGSCMIFITAPDLKTLEKRLILRNKDDRKTINMRLKNARKELKFIKKYDYLIVNKNLNDAIKAAQSIIEASKYKIR
jgi:guanylate kinase